GWRIHLWFSRRQIWAPHSAHGRHHLLFADGIADRVGSQLHGLSHLARALRNRHGRGMGTGRVARDGVVAHTSARFVFRNLATRLRVRLSARRVGLLDNLSFLWLARS